MGGIKIKLSALIGSIFCIIADLLQKTDASAVRNIGLTLGEFFEIKYTSGKFFALGLIILGSFALSFIFEPKTKPKAFYLGASVLAIMMALVPYENSPSFSTTPNSEKVTVRVSTQDNVKIMNAELTLWNQQMNRILARTRLSDGEYKFYQREGRYNLTVHMQGYEETINNFEIFEGSALEIEITLYRSMTPTVIDRLLR